VRFSDRAGNSLRDADEFSAAAVDHVAQVRKLAAVIVLTGDASGAFAAGHAGGENNFLANAHGGNVRADLGNFAETSLPGIWGSGMGTPGMPARTQRSRWFRAQALTRTRTSFRGGLLGQGHPKISILPPAVRAEDNRFHESSDLGSGFER